jgi:hypothetical protein
VRIVEGAEVAAKVLGWDFVTICMFRGGCGSCYGRVGADHD